MREVFCVTGYSIRSGTIPPRQNIGQSQGHAEEPFAPIYNHGLRGTADQVQSLWVYPRGFGIRGY